MALLDHFHPPVSARRGWSGFHGQWAARLAARLNESVLGAELFADMQIHVGGGVEVVEVDVAALTDAGLAAAGNGHGGAAVAAAPAWAPPAVELVAPAVFPDDIEVRVFSTAEGAVLVGAIELVSPANKDRPDTRRAFAAKCVAYLTRGVGVVVVDIVTSRLANLHNEVVGLLGLGPPYPLDPAPPTYAVSYRPVRRRDGDQIDMWRHPLAVGGPLPVMPLGLRNLGVVPVDLGGTYAEACRAAAVDRAVGAAPAG